MFEPMIRKKQQMELNEASALLQTENTGVLSVLTEQGYPYGVPVNYAWKDSVIYFHSGKQGLKVRCMQKNNQVCFTVIGQDQVVGEELTTYYTSVVVFGKVRLAEGAERTKGLMALCEKYSSMLDFEIRKQKCESNRTANLYVIEPVQITGKKALELVSE
ncbi:MAG: pyridoxamine 5'-phosphate oxidase family protein [Pygmaiobacter massiliensis]|nr:pyridoxamine 5'-phosphate oxidase family protein [Pygmaiobacter massiliensis]